MNDLIRRVEQVKRAMEQAAAGLRIVELAKMNVVRLNTECTDYNELHERRKELRLARGVVTDAKAAISNVRGILVDADKAEQSDQSLLYKDDGGKGEKQCRCVARKRTRSVPRPWRDDGIQMKCRVQNWTCMDGDVKLRPNRKDCRQTDRQQSG